MRSTAITWQWMAHGVITSHCRHGTILGHAYAAATSEKYAFLSLQRYMYPASTPGWHHPCAALCRRDGGAYLYTSSFVYPHLFTAHHYYIHFHSEVWCSWQPSAAPAKLALSVMGPIAEMLSAVQAISDRLGVKMYIITSYEQSGVIEIKPNGSTKGERILYLSFWAEVPFHPPSNRPRFCLLLANCSWALWLM